MTSRRNLLTAIGTGVAGVGVLVGSGAFTRVTADRTFDVQLADDTDAQLVIEENSDLESTAVTTDGNGNFAFDADGTLSDGVTTYGVFEDLSDASSLARGAFVIRNENDTGEDVDISAGIDDDPGDTTITLALLPPGNGDVQTTTAGNGDATVEDVSSAESDNTDSIDDAEVECGLHLDTSDGADGELDATLSITAERSPQDQ